MALPDPMSDLVIRPESNYLQDLVDQKAEGFSAYIIHDYPLLYAPSDKQLMHMLLDEIANCADPNIRGRNFGFNTDYLPDTQFMINIIAYLNPGHELLKGKLPNRFSLYPVPFRN